MNPAHLRAGTHADNMADMAAKGRAKAPRGGQHYAAKLSEEQVRTILSDSRPAKEVADEYGVKAVAIYHIREGKNWKHLRTEV